jgi:hypothetical protein
MEDRLQPLVHRSRALSTVPFLFSPGWLTLSLRSGFFFSRRYLRHRSRLLSARTARTS